MQFAGSVVGVGELGREKGGVVAGVAPFEEAGDGGGGMVGEVDGGGSGSGEVGGGGAEEGCV